MTENAQCVGEKDTLVDAALKMRELDVGSLPICGEDGRLKGMVTDRDIVIRCIALGGDPATTLAGEFASTIVTIGADDDVNDALEVMEHNQIRRLPVIDGHELVGMINQADIALAVSNEQAGEVVEEISEPS